MSISPLLTFKAGKCHVDTSSTPWIIKAVETPGYIYLYIDDDLVHFCWRPRSASVNDPELDLLMIPSDGSFVPYTGPEGASSSEDLKSPTNGRVFVLKFSSSSQRQFFWMQSKTQHPEGDQSWFSPRDQRLGQIVDMLLSGEEIDVQDELRQIPSQPRGGDDDDEMMEDAPGSNDHHRQGSGGAGADATGGDVRNEGEESREGGADGGRAPNDASAIVQNFLNSLSAGNPSSASASQPQGKLFTTLPDLLPASTTIPIVDAAPTSFIDTLLANLPPQILLLAQEGDDLADAEPDPSTVQAAIEALSVVQKKDILRRVLRSPQLSQGLGSLTSALRDGGLPMVAGALGIKVDGGGYVRGGGVPLGGGEAVEAFLEAVRKDVEKEESGMDVE